MRRDVYMSSLHPVLSEVNGVFGVFGVAGANSRSAASAH